MPQLVEPTTRLYDAWQASHEEWGPGRHEDGFGIRPEDDVETRQGFVVWVHRLRRESDPSVPPAPGRVPTSYWWILEDGAVVGGIALRHRLNERLLAVLGQVGYGIRPSARGRGLARWALGEVLTRAEGLGLDRVLVACDDANVASARVIEGMGGGLEDVRDTDLGRVRRYWVPTGR